MFMVTHDSPVSSKQTSNKNACNKKLSTGEIFMKMTMVCFRINQLVTEDHGNVQQIFHCENQPCWVLVTNNQLVAEIENICDDKDCVDFKNDSFFVCSEFIVGIMLLTIYTNQIKKVMRLTASPPISYHVVGNTSASKLF